MGIVNVTPDSFSDGGRFLDPVRAVEHGLELAAQGARILDVGGESTRPGAVPVPESEELRRVVPVIRRLRGHLDSAGYRDVVISVDTTKSGVAERALDAGAEIVNDISGLTFDDRMPAVCAAHGVGVVCMHIRGTPQTMQNDPRYDDVVREVAAFLRHRTERLVAEGIDREAIVIDPGIGFGKTAAHNLELLRSVGDLLALRRPVLIGHSRKRFLKYLLGRPVEERLAGTLGVSIALAEAGVHVLRVHDVGAVRDAIAAYRAVKRGPLPPATAAVAR
ncbi:MAG: dihydropteroate synthase [Planctomycetota bacterium]|nr:MAG: dihydropteroate synthase [Planctomycetota bacterium]